MAITVQQAAQELNQTMSKLGYEYQIDTSTDEAIEKGFKTVGAFPPSMQSCILDMQMKILQTRAYTSMFTESDNPTRRFWRDAVDYGGGIQDIFVKLIPSVDGFWASDFCEDNNWGGYGSKDALTDAIARDLVSYKKDDVISKIHVITDKFAIPFSISDLEFAKVFTPAGYADFIGAKYQNFQASVEAKLMDIAIGVIQKMVAAGHVVFREGLGVNNANDVTGTVEAINTVADGMKGLTSLYNYDGVRTKTNFDDMYLVVTPEFFNRIKSRGYANAFNLEEYRNKNRLIMLPAGTSLGTNAAGDAVGAILLDYRAVTIAVRYWEVGTFIVQNTDYRNSWNKLQLITGYTEFFNAVAFVTGEVGNFTNGSRLYTISTTAGNDTIDYKNIESAVKVNGKPLKFNSPESGAGGYLQVSEGSLIEIDYNEMNSMELQYGSHITYNYTTMALDLYLYDDLELNPGA